MCKHCVKCHAFAWWDGDFCCTMRMSIMEGAPDGKFWAILPDAFNANKCNDYNERDNYKNDTHEYYNQYIKFLRDTIEDSKNISDDDLLEKYGYKHYERNTK